MKFVNTLPTTEEDCEDAETLAFHSHVDHGVTDDHLAGILPYCPNLQAVDFTGVPDLSDRTVVILAQTTTALKTVDISGCKLITDVGVLELASQANRLEVVKLNGLIGLKDPSISALVRSLSRLAELDIGDLPWLTSNSVRDIWTFGKKLRKVRLGKCGYVDDKGFPLPIDPSSNPVSPGGGPSAPAVIPGQRSLRHKSTAVLSGHGDGGERVLVMSDPSAGNRASLWLEALPPLILPGYHILEHLHSLDIAHCKRITDGAVAGIVAHAPRLQHIHLAGCSLLTNTSVEKLCLLKTHLETLTISHAEKLTDTAILDLARACPKLAVIEVSHCSLLTDLSVLELAILSNLRRLSIAGLHLITDVSLLFLAEHASNLVQLHISHCVKISLNTIHVLLRRLPKLEHFSASGLKAMSRIGIKRFSEKPPAHYDPHKLGPYRVFKGEGITALRAFLDKEEERLREAEKRNIPFIPRGDDSMDLY